MIHIASPLYIYIYIYIYTYVRSYIHAYKLLLSQTNGNLIFCCWFQSFATDWLAALALDMMNLMPRWFIEGNAITLLYIILIKFDIAEHALHLLYECPELEYLRYDVWFKSVISVSGAMAKQIYTWSAKSKQSLSSLHWTWATLNNEMMFIAISFYLCISCI